MPVASVTPIEASVPTLYMCSDMLDQFNLKADSVIILRAGTTVTKVKIITSLNGNLISELALERLGLPKKKNLLIRKVSEEIIQIGPLIGILISREKKRRIPPHSSQKKLLLKFLRYCNKNNLMAFVFFPEDVDFEKNMVKGLYLEKNIEGTLFWKSHVFPLPDVVYDRILRRTLEKKPTVKLVKSYFKNQPSVSYFNPKFLDKWETHSILSGNPFLREHLPTTLHFDNPAKIKALLEDFKTVYIKPIHGSLGQGIIKISRLPEGYCSQHRNGSKNLTQNFHTLEELLAAIENLKKQRIYVVQQGLELLRYQNRVFDIRVLVQKNKYGNWTFTAMVARIAQEGSIFPNIAAGGEAVNIETVWNDLFGTSWSSSETCTLTKEVSLAAAHTLEQALGTFCEIGLDIGVDNEGNIWIIEVNSKPSRKVFPKDQLALKTASLKMPMDYAAYLTGFIPKQEMNDIEP